MSKSTPGDSAHKKQPEPKGTGKDTKKERARKERVLHTRVPDVLDRELKRLAESLRVPVSNVVRAILMDAVEAADAMGQAAEGEIRSVADRLRSQRDKMKQQTADALRAGPPLPASSQATPTANPSTIQQPPLAGVLGFQPLLIARATTCVICGVAIHAGEQAFIGVGGPPGHAPIIGRECLPFAHQQPAPSPIDPHPQTDKEPS